ncbi:hypothetical protein C7C56_025950 [Massilia glaciei]|uniref:Uncharacterized protein n=2 Tax=Massilia glaciei TaxID=1524097 RepID=A0A2U2HBZ6_9BURK|nr:hypothetical protein C7C56_025950 [Massilia glaciei]
MKVVGPNGVVREIAYGHYENCEGNTLYITGWIDEQHLVFRDHSFNYRVFETSTGNTADLFNGEESMRIFDW